ncbi:MAG TPA: hypothetical protein VIQ00_16475, partial [Chitinophagaceae bacterium]
MNLFMKAALNFFIVFILVSGISAQTVPLKGKIFVSVYGDQQPLENVTVELMSGSDSALVKAALTD